MHELPFVINLLKETDAVAREQGLTVISRVNIEVGELSGIVPECVSLYFETASEGHAADGARLTFKTAPAVLVCPACGHEFDYDRSAALRAKRDPFDCPACGSPATLKKGSGADARLISVEGE